MGQWISSTLLSGPPVLGGRSRSARDQALDRDTYETICDDALDYWAGGAAQRAHLRRQMARRLGEISDPRESGATAETDDGRIIREDRTELYTVPYLRAVVESLAVLYSSDGLDRVYLGSDGEEDLDTRTITEEYHTAGWMAPRLQLLDAMVVLLRTAHLLVRWCEDLGRIVYDVVPPHWVWIQPHHRYPLETDLAYAVAYSERSDDGSPTWVAYTRPLLSGDSNLSSQSADPLGRCVRYQQAGSPWPIPAVGHGSILDDGVNPLVEIGGMDGPRPIWSPLIWHWAEPPMESLHLVPADDLARANLEIDLALSLLMYVANAQSAGQPVMTGAGQVPSALGPSHVIRILDPAGSFTYASPGADLEGHLTVIRQLLQIQSMLRHLAPDTFSLTRPSIQTGPAKLLEQNALVEARNRRTEIAARSEAARFDLERLLHNAHADPAIPRIGDGVRLSMRWGELRVPPDRAAQVQRLSQEINAGISTAVDAVMEIWGLDRAAAEQKIRENSGAGSVVVVEQIADGAPSDSAIDDRPAEAVDPTTALNGAQVTALLAVVQLAAAGQIPRDTAKQIIAASFPIDDAGADRILGPVGQGFVPEQETPTTPVTAPPIGTSSVETVVDRENNG